MTVTFSCKDGQFTSTKAITIRVTGQSNADKAKDPNNSGSGPGPNAGAGPSKPEQIPVTIKINLELLSPACGSTIAASPFYNAKMWRMFIFTCSPGTGYT